MFTRLTELQNMLLAEPGDAFLRYAIALELAKAGQLQQAIAETIQLIHEQPDYLGAYYQLGKWLEQNNQSDKALDIYRRGVAIAEKQNKKKALAEFQEAIWMLEDEL
jgi:tetratricopeptide (TPR) repeat protein